MGQRPTGTHERARRRRFLTRVVKGDYCGGRPRLPVGHYVVREKRLRRLRRPGALAFDDPRSLIGEVSGLVNMGPDADEIWWEQTLNEAEKRFITTHELVHARRQMAGEELDEYMLEETVVELEAIARSERKVLGAMPNGQAMVVLHDFLTARGEDSPNTVKGLSQIHDRIRLLLGGIKTTAC